MKKLIILSLTLVSLNAMAYEEAWQTFMNAVTVCPADSNPLTVMKNLGGNSFTDVKYFDMGSDGFENRVTAMIVNDPKIVNPLLMRPTRLLGTIKVEMDYPYPGRGLKCTVTKL